MLIRTLLTMLLAAAPALAWNSVGHMAIAKIAYDDMDDATKAKLFALLQKHPHYAEFLVAGKPEGVAESEWVIMRSAVWADWIRPRRKENRVNVARYSRGEEHYVNVPLIAEGDAEFFAGKTLVNPDLPNILTALKTRSNDLRTKAAAIEDKAIAATWFYHLVGDVHQPMHNVAYFANAKGFVTGDLGGNKFGVRFGDRKMKLHTMWDDLLGTDRDYNDDSGNHQAELYKLAVQAAERMRAVALTDEDKAALERNITFDSWSAEGFALAKSVAYRTGDGTAFLKAVEVPFDGAIPDDVPELGEAYMKRARETAEKRAFIAGKRLATRTQALMKDVK